MPHLTWGGRLTHARGGGTTTISGGSGGYGSRVGGKAIALHGGIMVVTGLRSHPRLLEAMSEAQRKRLAGNESCCFAVQTSARPVHLLLEAASVAERDSVVRCLRRLLDTMQIKSLTWREELAAADARAKDARRDSPRRHNGPTY